MRHRVKGRKLNRTASHRLATMRSLATALFLHKKIKTTVAKAKTARLFVEPLITKAKNGSVHAHRLVARHITNREAMHELFGQIVEKVADRPGGYTRVVKLGQRRGDGAEMAILELVDFGETGSNKTKKKSKKKTENVIAEPIQIETKNENIEDAEVVEETETEEEKVEHETVVVENSDKELSADNTEQTDDAVQKEEEKEESATAAEEKKSENK